VLRHAIGRRLPILPEPPPKESIRRSFENERQPQSIPTEPTEMAQTRFA
jgi:hypothetical protein